MACMHSNRWITKYGEVISLMSHITRVADKKGVVGRRRVFHPLSKTETPTSQGRKPKTQLIKELY